MALSKTQTWAKVQELLSTHKVSAKVAAELELLLSPKAGGGVSEHPHKTDDKGNIIEAWCKYHEQYEPIENMVVSNDKPKGYCKAAASKSNKLRNESKSLDQKVIAEMADGNLEGAQKTAMEAKALSTMINHPSKYDFKKDWAEFNAPKAPKES